MAQWLEHGEHLPRKGLGSKVTSTLRKALKSKPSPATQRGRRIENVRGAMLQLLRRKLPLDHDDVVTLLTWSGHQEIAYWCGAPQMIKVVENYLKEYALTTDIQKRIKGIVARLGSGYSTAETRRWAGRLKDLGNLEDTSLAIVEGEAWSDAAIHDVEAMNSDVQSVWVELVNVCASASGSKPTAKWSKQAESLLNKVGFDAFKQSMLEWFPLVDKPRTQVISSWSSWQPDPNLLLHERNADVLKGMVWLCAKKEDQELARALTTLALSAYRKAPGRGPRCVRVGNACVWALGQMPGLESVGQLALLKVRVKYGTAQKGIEKALTKAAERAGLPQDEIEEMAVPAYEMEKVGLRREQLGEYTAELVVTGSTVQLRWIRPDGKPQKSVPKAVKESYAEELKSLKQAVKDVRKMIPAQRSRIENLYLEQKRWDFSTWRARYLDHPLVGTLARRIIWKFSDSDRVEAGIWYDERFVTHDGTVIDWLSDSVQVELWHPINETTETIVAWRNWLIEYTVQQPFKQAHREIYLLTDAERDTRVYSNRFAAHIIKQHQFNALCGARNWKNKLRLMVDDVYPPATRRLPSWGIRAEFWIEGIGDNYGTDTTVTGTWLYLTTDQVRFHPIDTPEHYAHAAGGGYYADYRTTEPGEPIPLEDIPPLMFTEVMRDVDLFVGVASIGNDPNWIDGGPEVQHYNYWHRYSFGELSAAAKTRKQVLESLIPWLKIADRCELTDKFLCVRGDIRTYKIHLGSSNILMSPNDQYLCIVPARGAASKGQAGKVFLPFEGDNTMALILSKAFLLAEDKKIKDSTILRQITA
ncbi:MAG: DUF4132 domain-containing protein [Chloroflexi bacterium]|nr:DUF4132 domain-containing protein [Chloroflexota bacterium]